MHSSHPTVGSCPPYTALQAAHISCDSWRMNLALNTSREPRLSVFCQWDPWMHHAFQLLQTAKHTPGIRRLDSILKISQPPHHAKCCSPSYIPLHKVLQCVYKYTNHTLCIHLLGYYLCFTWSCHWEVTSAAAKQWVYKPKIKHTDTLIRYTKLLLFIQQIYFWCVKSLLKIYKPQLCLENTKVPHFKPGMKHELV